MSSRSRLLATGLLSLAAGFLIVVLLVRTGGPGASPVDVEGVRARLEGAGLLLDAPDLAPPGAEDALLLDRFAPGGADGVTVDYPHDGSVFPPEIVPPTMLWHDATAADVWLVEIAFGDGVEPSVRALVPGPPPPPGEIDPQARSLHNEVYVPTPYQASARSWTPSSDLWRLVKERSVGTPAVVTFTGFALARPEEPLSSGRVAFTTSADPVGAPIFYRDVPLMPAVSEERGVIQPLDDDAIPIISWRLRDIGRPESKVVLRRMTTCANCHSFSLDGKTLGMDVDGPTGDKGSYAVADVEKHMSIDQDDVLTWNSFPDKPEGHKTIGFLSRISPDGRYVVSTVNESLYVNNFADHGFLQVFYPTGGILAVWSRATGEMKALPGADDPAYVHCMPAWAPDGKSIVFMRARARPPYVEGQEKARYPNDPAEPFVQYDLYRMPFDEGRGGTPEPVRGASDDGMSNTFPKVSPDGKWIVFTKCWNGMLLRPDGRLWIVPFEGGEAREMRCNTDKMNSWHGFSPNSRWLVFSSKTNTPYTQMFLTHVDEDGNDSPAILVPNSTAANRAVNLPEFLNAPYDALERIEVPAVGHHAFAWDASELIDAGRYDEAEALLDKSLAENPDHVPSLVMRGNLYLRKREVDRAADLFQRALARAPRDAFALHGMGLVHRARGEREEAIQGFRQTVREYPDHLEARRDLADALAEEGRFAEAADSYRVAVWIAPDHAPTRCRLAEVLLELHRPKEAVVQLEQATAAAPDDVAAHLGLAWLLATYPDPAVRDGARAVDQARTACALAGDGAPAPLDVLAAALAEAGRFDEAIDAAHRALALARRTGPPRMAEDLAARLALYQAGRAYRTP